MIHEISYVALLHLHFVDPLEQHLKPLVDDALSRFPCVALCDELEHLTEYLLHLHLHVFLRGLQLGHVHPVTFNGFIDPLHQLIFECLDLRHSYVDRCAQVLEAFHFGLKLLRMHLKFALHMAHLSVDRFKSGLNFLAFETNLLLKPIDVLEAPLHGSVGAQGFLDFRLHAADLTHRILHLALNFARKLSFPRDSGPQLVDTISSNLAQLVLNLEEAVLVID